MKPLQRPALILLTYVVFLLCSGVAVSASLVNISGRVNVGVGNSVAIGGLIVTGSGNETLVIRGIGASLPLPNKLVDPFLQLYNSNGTLIYQNNNWRDTQEGDIAASGLAPTNDLESAIKIILPAGAYTAILTGANGGTGIGSIEVYQTGSSGTALANLSTRGNVSGGGDSQAVVGIILNGSGSKDLLFRGIGPSLQLPGLLANPILTLFDGSGSALASNDNWRDSQQSAIAATGIAPSSNLESAIRRTLSPGAYTAVLRDYNYGSGIGSVEVYDVTGYPAATPPPVQRLVWQDGSAHGQFVGKGWSVTNPNLIEAELSRTAIINPQSVGAVTVTMTGNAWRNCGYSGCTQNLDPGARIYAQLLDQNGNLVATGGGPGFSIRSQSVTASTSFNTLGAPYIIRFMATSTGQVPQTDYVTMTSNTVYSP